MLMLHSEAASVHYECFRSRAYCTRVLSFVSDTRVVTQLIEDPGIGVSV